MKLPEGCQNPTAASASPRFSGAGFFMQGLNAYLRLLQTYCQGPAAFLLTSQSMTGQDRIESVKPRDSLHVPQTARLGKPTGLALAAALVITVTACMGERMQTPPFYKDLARVDGEVDTGTASQMISQYRSNNGLSGVVPDPQLTAIAKSQAEAMARAGTVKASLAQNMQLATRMASIGEPRTSAAENVSAGYRTFAEAFSGWRESPNHNAVLLTKDATRLGIATAYSSTAKHKVFWSLVMAAPGPAASAQ